MKLFIWSAEYDLFVCLAETVQEAREKILEERNIIDIQSDSSSSNYDELDMVEHLELITSNPTFILESGAKIFAHGNW